MRQAVNGPGGRKLSVDITGAPAGKPVVFLLHGTPGSLNGPRPRGIFLHRLGVRLISYNRPGYPGSDRQEERTVADAAADIEAIADALDIEDFSVVGRSGGGPHALAVAASKEPGLRRRVKCVAALSSLAPYDAVGLDWFSGMAESNVEAYKQLRRNLPALVATFNQRADEVRDNSQGLLRMLWPELVGADKEVIGDIALRMLIAETHQEALRESVHGWLDDVAALGHPWDFELSNIEVPVLLWHGHDDVFTPVTHTKWLASKIDTSECYTHRDTAHFGAVEIFPDVLRWVLGQMHETGTNWASRSAAVSERLGVNRAQQPLAASGSAHVRMLGTELGR